MQATNESLQFLGAGVFLDEIKTAPVKKIGIKAIVNEGIFGTWNIPDYETLKLCTAYAHKLSLNHPTWNSVKVARKVAERYKLKPL